jgi:uncharacterized repeat protein (TIGR01451 family)
VKQADSDPLINSALVETHPEGYSFTVAGNDSKDVELFQPGITLEKSSDVISALPGDDILYTILITNTSSLDSPDLIIDAITDSIQGDLTEPANYDTNNCGSSLSPSAACTITYTYTVQPSDEDSVENTATVQTHPNGFTNDIDATDSISVIIGMYPDLFLPIILK